jgi:hypothetical protein
MKKYWDRLVCYFAGHKYTDRDYVPGSWTLRCARCGDTYRM